MTWPDALTPRRLVLTPERVAAYAEVTQDFNPLHLDPAFAATTSFGGPIAHGTLNLALVWEAAAATFGASAGSSVQTCVTRAPRMCIVLSGTSARYCGITGKGHLAISAGL